MKNDLQHYVKFLLLFVLFCVFTLARAQDRTLALVNKTPQTEEDQDRQKTLKEALLELESRFQVKFAFNEDVVEGKHVKGNSSGEKNIEDVLSAILRPLKLKYVKVDEENYVIKSGAKKKDLKKVKRQNLHAPTGSSQHPGRMLNFSKASGKLQLLEKTITGTVIDLENGEPLPGVNVVVKSTTTGTVTDVDGNYRLTVSDEADTLVFSSVGYVSEEIIIGNRTTIDVQMAPDIQSLSEVVVVGYGAVKKEDLTGSVSQVSEEEITAFPVPTADQALRGRVAGVRVTQNSGSPGARTQIQIRGGNSILGSNAPLFVVDGFPLTGGIDFLNPADIASIDILKDASATAIYGSRGANGVVIITTKQGREGEGRINIESYYGIQTVRKRFDLLNARQFAEIANEAAINDGETPPFDLDEVGDINTDWQDVIFRPAPIQNHTLGFSGGSEKSQYSISANYFKQEGVVISSGTQKGSLRASLNQEVNDRVTLSTNIALTRSELNNIRGDNRVDGVLSGAWSAPPLLPPYDSAGNFTDVAQFAFSPNILQNPLAFAQVKNQLLETTILGNVAADIEIAEGLNLKILGGTEQNLNTFNFYSPSILSTSPNGNASTSLNRNISYLNENILTFNRTVREVDQFTFTGGFTWQQFTGRYNTSSGSGFPNDVLQNNNLGAAEITNPNTSFISEWTLLSWLGRINYTLNDKYLFTASVRADGSSRFGENNKWGVFPSGAFAWRLSDEAFIENLDVFSNLKLRLSYGVTGSTAVDPYQSLNQLSPYRATFGKSDVIGFAPGIIPNPDLRWETTAQFDAGLDMGFMNERLRITMDYYRKNTNDLLLEARLPPSLGFTTITRNLGEIQNTGFELGIGYDVLVNEFKWDLFGQLSANRNEVVNIGGVDILGDGLNIPLSAPINLAREGEPLGVFYGFVEDGLDENGRIQYRDLEPDGEITIADKTIIGSPYPDFIYSLNSNFSFRNFALNVFFEGVSGNDIVFATAGTLANSFRSGENQLVDVYYNHWTPENPDPNAEYPIISQTNTFEVSDRFIEDGSYLRLKNIRLSYNLPVSGLDINWVRSLQLYVSGQNLLTFTNYPGLDPEVNTRGQTGDLRIGIDEKSYPSTKIYTFGIKVGL